MAVADVKTDQEFPDIKKQGSEKRSDPDIFPCNFGVGQEFIHQREDYRDKAHHDDLIENLDQDCGLRTRAVDPAGHYAQYCAEN